MFGFENDNQGSQENSGKLVSLMSEIRRQMENGQSVERTQGLKKLRESARTLAWQRLTSSAH